MQIGWEGHGCSEQVQPGCGSSSSAGGTRTGSQPCLCQQVACQPIFLRLKLTFSRSAALLKLGHPNLALEDIAEAVKAGYPQELTYKVKMLLE